MRHLLAFALAAAGLLWGGGALAGLPRPAAGAGGTDVYAREMLVKLAPGTEGSWVAPGWRVVRAIRPLGWVVVDVGADDPASAIQRARRAPGVLAAEPHQFVRIPAVRAPAKSIEPGLPDDPDLDKQERYFARIRLKEAWGVTMGDPRVVVAVVDTGIDARHPDLAGQLVPGYDIVHDTADPRDDNSHGTACAGIVAARAGNGIGLAGIAPGCRVMPVKVLDRLGNGPLELAARGFVWAVDHGASIISFSSGEDAPSQVLQDAIDYARAHDVVVLASMGNDGETVKHWPACCDGVLAVGATYTEDDQPALFTTQGSWVGLAAPGDLLWTTMPTYHVVNPISEPPLNYGLFAGTSGSCPIVAGVAALLRSQYPRLTEAQVRERLKATADDVGPPGWDDATGSGRVNAWRALTAPLPRR